MYFIVSFYVHFTLANYNFFRIVAIVFGIYSECIYCRCLPVLVNIYGPIVTKTGIDIKSS